MLINNRYQVIRNLGEGGFGQAYLAEDTQMPSKRQCVIKQLKPITDSTEIYELVQARFQREAAILEQLGENHPQIPRLYAYFTENKNFYLVQEWIEGETLESLPLPQSEPAVRALLTSLLPVLEFVHGQGIIHRDIKPGNIILREGSQQPALIDFGAVKETINTGVGENLVSSIVIGTPGYMATEQAAGRPLASSDLYSLALTAVYLLTGKPPHELPSDAQTGEILWQPVANGVSSALRTVLTKAIQYHPRDRYSSASEMLAALSTLSHASTTTETLPATVIHLPAAIHPSAAAHPSARDQRNLESAPTQVRAPAKAQAAPPQQASSHPSLPNSNNPKAIAPLALGLIGIAIAGTVIAGGWVISRPSVSDNNAPKEEPAVSTDDAAEDTADPVASEDTTSPPETQPLSLNQKCFSLIAYDPEDSSINVRDSPNGNVVEAIPNLSMLSRKGTTAVATSWTQEGWNDVQVSDTTTSGYIWGELLYRTAYQVNDPLDTFVNLRDAPNGDIVTALDNGTEVRFLGTEEDWTQIQVTLEPSGEPASEQTGYVSTSLLAEPDCSQFP